MLSLGVAAISLNQTPLDWEGNRLNIAEALQAARAAGASLVVLPELCLSGYGCEDAFLWPATRETALELLQEIEGQTKGLIVSVGLPLEVDGRVYNGAALVVDGRLQGVALKQNLADEGIHYEPRWFTPWRAGQKKELLIDGRKIPVGDLVFDIGGLRLGFEICEDAWVHERTGISLARSRVDILLGPSASHFSFRKFSQRRRVVEQGVIELGVHYVYSNLLGNEAGRAIYDGDAFVLESRGGKAVVLAETTRFSFASRSVALARLPLPQGNTRPCLPSQEESGGPQLVSVSFDFSKEERPTVHENKGAPRASLQELSTEEALARSLSLGLFDYLRKSHSRGFVVSLSGGADSAAVVTLVYLMVSLGLKELSQGFLERLGLELPEMSLAKNGPEQVKTIVHQLLVTVYQKTVNSSQTTCAAAAELAGALGAEHHVIDVNFLVDHYRQLSESMLGRELSWERDDLALQNIQARVRAPSVWMMANLKGALLLTTSNRSEAAVGYATMDGDTAGGLCPLGGVGKTLIRKWLVFMQEQGLPETGPLLVLAAVNSQQPTAELRPVARTQTDEEDLMPYEILDRIERAVVFERLSPKLVLKKVRDEFTQYESEQLLHWVKRFYRLFSTNQWKRERYAPSFHVDDTNLDPKTWLRFPILSGGFQRELSQLS